MGQKTRKIEWGKRALKQIHNIYEFIAKDSLKNAIKVRDAISDSAYQASKNPERFPPDKFKKMNDGSYRYFTKYRYRVSYRVRKDKIHIIRIRHTSRKATLY